MAVLDQQLGIFEESTYGTSGTPNRFYEFNKESVKEDERRTQGNPLRTGGNWLLREDRHTPYFGGAAGSIEFDVMQKGFGLLLKHMLGSVTTSGVGPFTHTATFGDLLGKSLTVQFSRPFRPSGTAQPFLYKGGKVTKWGFANSVDTDLVLTLDMDFQQVDTATGLASASYPTSMDNLTWAGAVINIGGSAYDVTEFAVSCENGLDVDRRQLRGNTDKKEPDGAQRNVTWSLKADFDSLTQRNRAHATAKATTIAQIQAVWTMGTSSLTITIPTARFDEWTGYDESPQAINQELSGIATTPAAGGSPVTIAYVTPDATP